LPQLAPGGAATRPQRASQLLQTGRELIRTLHKQGNAGISTGRLLTALADRLVAGLWEEVLSEQGAPAGLCLVALGSYGRRELSPHSDLDLLLLTPKTVPAEALAPAARTFQVLLWDLKLTLGFSTRTFAESARAADMDHTVRTALMDARRVAGSTESYERFLKEVLRPLSGRKVDGFIAAKVRELRARREKFGDSVFVLEPHLKQGEGGLRDLEAMLWVAEARYKVHGVTGLLRHSILPPGEVEQLRWGRDLLLRCRHELHFSSGRKEDRLTFERQEQVAEFFGYPARAGHLPVERFMRDYYLAASAIRKACDALVARAEEREPGVGSALFERRLGKFKVRRGKLMLGEAPDILTREPARALELLRVADESGLELASLTRDQLSQAVRAIQAARATQQVVTALKALLVRPGTRGAFLVPMHELGILGAVLPEFGRITAFHQHDLYHVYTVDVHSLFALRRLYALRAGDLFDEQPEFTREMQALEDPLPLYLGMLFHDAGKGMGGNHSQRGKELMVQVGERLGLTQRQREVSEFLVLHHLLMSHTAQRRDLNDPKLVAEFARAVSDVERLSCLYLLTYADIASVGPQMWNEWKAQLLHELNAKAQRTLAGEDPATVMEPSGPSQAFHSVWRRAFGTERADAMVASLPARYFTSTDARRAILHAGMLARGLRLPAVGALRRHPSADFSELTLVARDRPGLLALFAGVLSAHRVDILRARIASTTDGIVLDVFEVRGPGGLPLERSKWRAARTDLWRVLVGEVTVEEVLRKRRGTALLRRHVPHVPLRVVVDNQASQDFTVVDVQAEDQVGLLYAIASALHRVGTVIALAQVSTEANRATDSFYITREGEKVADLEAVRALTQAVEDSVRALG
jgi:[protein-PII] uridylyltransferase